MQKVLTTIAILLIAITLTYAQEPIKQLKNVELLNLEGKPAVLPRWGEKNLLVFYIDPDRAGQNKEFTDWLEDSKRIESDNILGFGVMNLKDAPFIPNRLARAMANKRAEKSNAIVLSDDERIIATEWELGDCNNCFVVLIINTAGELLYMHKGVMTPFNQAQFLEVIDLIKEAE